MTGLKPIHILLADDCLESCMALKQRFEATGCVHCTCLQDGVELLDCICAQRPDAVVMEVLLKHTDGVRVLHALMETEGEKPLLAVYSALQDPAFLQHLRQCNVDYFFSKQTGQDVVVQRVLQAIRGKRHRGHITLACEPVRTYTVQIATLLKQLGVPAHLCGYRYLRRAVELAVQEPSILFEMTSRLYPQIAQEVGSTPARVERSIRYAIEAAFERGRLREIERMFGFTIDSTKGKPSNSQCIAALMDRVQLCA